MRTPPRLLCLLWACLNGVAGHSQNLAPLNQFRTEEPLTLWGITPHAHETPDTDGELTALTPDGLIFADEFAKVRTNVYDVEQFLSIPLFGYAAAYIDGSVGVQAWVDPDNPLWSAAASQPLTTFAMQGELLNWGTSILYYGNGEDLILREPIGGEILAEIRVESEYTAAAVSPELETAYTAAGTQLTAWPLADLTQPQASDLEPIALGAITQLFPQESGRIWALRGATTLQLWNTVTQTESKRISLSESPVSNATVSNDGSTLLTAHEDGYVRSFDLDSGARIGSWGPEPNLGAPLQVAFTEPQASNQFFTLYGSNTIVKRSLTEPNSSPTHIDFSNRPLWIRNVALSPDRAYLALTDFYMGRVYLVDVRNNTILLERDVDGHNLSYHRFPDNFNVDYAFSDDSSEFLIWSDRCFGACTVHPESHYERWILEDGSMDLFTQRTQAVDIDPGYVDNRFYEELPTQRQEYPSIVDPYDPETRPGQRPLNNQVEILVENVDRQWGLVARFTRISEDLGQATQQATYRVALQTLRVNADYNQPLPGTFELEWSLQQTPSMGSLDDRAEAYYLGEDLIVIGLGTQLKIWEFSDGDLLYETEGAFTEERAPSRYDKSTIRYNEELGRFSYSVGGRFGQEETPQGLDLIVDYFEMELTGTLVSHSGAYFEDGTDEGIEMAVTQRPHDDATWDFWRIGNHLAKVGSIRYSGELQADRIPEAFTFSNDAGSLLWDFSDLPDGISIHRSPEGEVLVRSVPEASSIESSSSVTNPQWGLSFGEITINPEDLARQKFFRQPPLQP